VEEVAMAKTIPTGTGHPNLMLEADYAPERGKPQWAVRVETRVEFPNEDFCKVQAWLHTSEHTALANYLIPKVPDGKDKTGKKRAQAMIAAACGEKSFASSRNRKRVRQSG
jgi:hypothetical protein